MPETASPKAAAPTAAKPQAVEAEVIVLTASHNPDKPALIAEAESSFKGLVAGNHGKDAKLSDIKYTVVKHHFGTSVTYRFTGQVA